MCPLWSLPEIRENERYELNLCGCFRNKPMSTTLLARSQPERLGAIAHPSLLIGDRQDAVFAACEQQHLARAMGRTLRRYRHAGHAPHWEEPGRGAEDVEDFLAQTGEPVAATDGGRRC